MAGVLAACGQQAPAPVVFNHQAGSRPSPSPSRSTVATAPLSTSSAAASSVASRASNVVAAPQMVPGVITVQPGDTVYALSRRYDRPVRAIIDENGLQPPYLLQSGQRIRIPGGRFHTVQAGETLYSISRAYGVDLYSTAQANDLQPPYVIAVGQQLRIPSSTGYAVAAAPPPAVPSGRSVDVEILPAPGSAPAAQSSAPATQVPQAQTPPSSRSPAPVPSEAPSQTAQQAPQQPAEQSAPQQEAAAPVAPTPAPSAASKPESDKETVLPPRSGRTFSWPVRGRILSTFGPKADGLHNDGINIAARAGAPVIAAENGVVVYAGNELRGFGNLLLVRHADGWITAYAHLDKMLVKKGQKVTRGQAIGTVGTSGGVSQPQLHFEIRRGTQAVDPAKFLSVA
jgi:murein DD-endopeptidase MepM/ murein hydrolase activator NlpD